MDKDMIVEWLLQHTEDAPPPGDEAEHEIVDTTIDTDGITLSFADGSEFLVSVKRK